MPCQRDLGGKILDLETAVKDGILDRGNEVGGCDLGFVEKVDLKTMIEELDSIDIPMVFICPISLDPMLDPVTLCTGQTYERSNILKWFSLGHFTCPTTMQELWDDSITPNHTLRQLILTWFSQKYSLMKKRSDDVEGKAMELITSLKKSKGQSRINILKSINKLITNHPSTKKPISEKGGIPLFISLLGPFTSHALGSEVVAILLHLSLDSSSITNLLQPSMISLMADLLNEGCIDTKINCTRLFELLIDGKDYNPEAIHSLSFLAGLMRLARDKRHPNGVLSGLRLLNLICSSELVRISVVNIGSVPQLIELLPNLSGECLELALFTLELLADVADGRVALKNCSKTMPNLVRLLMGVSERCSQLALSVLWAVFDLAPEECAALAVEAGLAAKLLLVIQSGCDPLLKQRSAELLKLCSLNYSTSMFISKCKLANTIQ